MRLLCLILALAVAACATHKQPATASALAEVEPPTAERCEALIEKAVSRMNAVDFNTDRKGEVTKYIAKARAEQAKGRFDKCISFADKAVWAS
jgi:cell division septum initiation protein DivIVA